MRKILMVVALFVMGLFALLAGLFIIGEAVADPGGWVGVGLIALWLVPLVVLVWFAWQRPESATWLLGGLSVLAVGLLAWSALDPTRWHDFQNANGPVLAIGVFAVAVPLTVLGWHRPLAAGGWLTLLGLTPLAVLALAGAPSRTDAVRPEQGLVVLAIPVVLTGVLLVIAGLIDREHKPRPSSRTSDGPRTLPTKVA